MSSFTAEELAKLSVKDLKKKCISLKISPEGRKPQLITAILKLLNNMTTGAIGNVNTPKVSISFLINF
jgi:hypothetical protein